MNGFSTSILLDATNEDCREHRKARALLGAALRAPRDWIVADQVYFELSRLLRNPAVLEHHRLRRRPGPVWTSFAASGLDALRVREVVHG